jgi:hypothetical protein
MSEPKKFSPINEMIAVCVHQGQPNGKTYWLMSMTVALGILGRLYTELNSLCHRGHARGASQKRSRSFLHRSAPERWCRYQEGGCRATVIRTYRKPL